MIVHQAIVRSCDVCGDEDPKEGFIVRVQCGAVKRAFEVRQPGDSMKDPEQTHICLNCVEAIGTFVDSLVESEE